MKLATRLIHSGQEPDPATGAIMTPVYMTSTFVQESPAVNKGYEYARSKNPTRTALENCLADIEGAAYGLSFASGVAATDAILKILQPGDEVIASDDMYGGTYRLFTKVYAKFGIRFRFASLRNPEALNDLICPATKLVWAETPTNPLMSITDIEAVAKICKSKKVLLCVDNTFASPWLQQPLALGADLVMHSATKYLGGHSDVIQGALMTNDKDLYEQLYFIQKSSGAVPGPMDCFLVLRGLKTLHVRMKAHCENGKRIAEYLRNHPKVQKVFWPGFEDHPGYDIAKKQMRDFGGMMSFILKDDSLANTKKLLESTKLFALAESLGGVESLINHPATMTHASIPAEERLKVGVVDGLIRLSTGIEDVDDLIADLDTALAAVK